jgi:hypothetical protein
MSDDTRPWERRAQEDQPVLEDALSRAGPEGLTLQQLAETVAMGKERFQQALRLLRSSPSVNETTEARLDRRGHKRQQIVFRHRASSASGTAPARVSRDPSVQATLAELDLIQAVAAAKAKGLRRPRAIARWILVNPLYLQSLSAWIDLETPLAEKVAALEYDGVSA